MSFNCVMLLINRRKIGLHRKTFENSCKFILFFWIFTHFFSEKNKVQFSPLKNFFLWIWMFPIKIFFGIFKKKLAGPKKIVELRCPALYCFTLSFCRYFTFTTVQVIITMASDHNLEFKSDKHVGISELSELDLETQQELADSESVCSILFSGSQCFCVPFYQIVSICCFIYVVAE